MGKNGGPEVSKRGRRQVVVLSAAAIVLIIAAAAAAIADSARGGFISASVLIGAIVLTVIVYILLMNLTLRKNRALEQAAAAAEEERTKLLQLSISRSQMMLLRYDRADSSIMLLYRGMDIPVEIREGETVDELVRRLALNEDDRVPILRMFETVEPGGDDHVDVEYLGAGRKCVMRVAVSCLAEDARIILCSIREVTEETLLRRRAEEERQFLERAAADTVMICQFDLEKALWRTISSCNGRGWLSGEDVSWQSVEPAMSSDAENFIHPDYKDVFLGFTDIFAMRDLFAQGVREHSAEYLARPYKDADWRWYRSENRLYMDPDSGRLLANVYVYDIDDEKREELLRQAELSKQKALLGSISEYILASYSTLFQVDFVTGELTVVKASDFIRPMMERASAAGSADMFSAFSLDTVHPDDQEIFNALRDTDRLRRQLAARGASTSYEFRSCEKGGDYTWHAIEFWPLTIENGMASRVIAAMKSIQDEKDARQTAVMADDRMSFISAISDYYSGIYIVNIGTDSCRGVKVPPIFRRYLSETGADFLRSFKQFFTECGAADEQTDAMMDINYADIGRLLELGGPVQYTFRRVDGRWITLSIYKTLSYSKKLPETLWIFEDSTEKIRQKQDREKLMVQEAEARRDAENARSASRQQEALIMQRDQSLRQATEMENLQSILSGAQFNPGSVDEALKFLGLSHHADRAYVFEFSQDDPDTMSNTHEWCSGKVQPLIGSMQGVSFGGLMPDWKGPIMSGETINISDTEAIRESLPAEYALLRDEQVSSVVFTPVKLSNGRVFGFLGLDNPSSVSEGEASLTFISNAFASAFESILEYRRINLLNELLSAAVSAADARVFELRRDGAIKLFDSADGRPSEWQDAKSCLLSAYRCSSISAKAIDEGLEAAAAGENSVFDIKTGEEPPRWLRVRITFPKGGDSASAAGTIADVSGEYEMRMRAQREEKYLADMLPSSIFICRIELDTGSWVNIGGGESRPGSLTWNEMLENSSVTEIDAAFRESVISRLRQEKLLDELRGGSDGFSLEYRARIRQSGEFKWLGMNVRLYFEPSADRPVANVYIRDINEEKLLRLEAERMKAVNESVYKVVNEMYYGIYYLDLASDSLTVIKQSPGAAHIFEAGGTFSDIFGRLIDAFAHPDFRDEMRAAFREDFLAEHLTPQSPEYRVENQRLIDGEYRWVLTFTRADAFRDGKAVSAIIASRDIQEMKMRQFAALREKEDHSRELSQALDRAEEASRAKSSFLFNMSHDLRTPMNAIINMTDLAEKNFSRPELVKEYLGQVEGASAHLLELINQVLDMARIESGKVALSERRCSLVSIVRDAEAIIRPQTDGKAQTFTADVSGIRGAFVRADRLRIGEVLLNLLSNACKYTPGGGTIGLAVTQLPGDGGDGKSIYEFRITDNGIGMSEEFQKRLFEPFAREEDPTTASVEGTGLGLPLVKCYVEMMGGEIYVRSRKGGGTSVTVRLPLRPEPDAPEDGGTQGPDTGDLSGRRALIVEDNEINRFITVQMLNSVRMKSDEAAGGSQALSMLDSVPDGCYDVIFMDIQMPGMNGYDTVRAIRASQREYLRRVPIIAVTANAFDEDRRKALEAGMDGFVSKPVSASALYEAIMGVLGK